jgi:hypothetical protein
LFLVGNEHALGLTRWAAMNTRVPLPFAAVLFATSLIAYPDAAFAQTPAGSWNITLSPTNSGEQTAVTIAVSGVLATGFNFSTGEPDPLSLGGVAIFYPTDIDAPPSVWPDFSGQYLVAPFGVITNVTQQTSMQLESIAFDMDQTMWAYGFDAISINDGDFVAFLFDPTPAGFVIDQNFSVFTPGTYSEEGGWTYNLEIVPEPSTYALLAMTAAGALWWARRRR